MAAKKKKCLAGHEGCEKCNLHCCAIEPVRGAEIAAQARSGASWARQLAYGPGCICGAGTRTLEAATALKGEGPGTPTGRCAAHPGGTVHREGEES